MLWWWSRVDRIEVAVGVHAGGCFLGVRLILAPLEVALSVNEPTLQSVLWLPLGSRGGGGGSGPAHASR